MSAPTTPDRAEILRRLVVDLGAAFHLRTSYAPSHPQVRGALVRVCDAFVAWCASAGSSEVSLLVLEGRLLVDRQPVPDDANWASGLLRAFDCNSIQGLTLRAGVDEAELGAFLDGCQGPTGPVSSRNVQVGRIGFAATESPEVAGDRGPGPGRLPAPAASAISPEQVADAREELRAVGSGSATRIERLRALVAELARSAEASSLDALRVAAAHVDDREFLHGLAVALSTARIGRALGIRGKELEDLTLAGFLHDVGHLESGGPGESREQARSRHPVRGAVRLATLEGIPDVAVLAALDHHLRFDGAQNYPVLTAPRRPVAAARVVAVADTWETLRANGETRPSEAIATLRSRAGTFLDPALVELFGELVGDREQERTGIPVTLRGRSKRPAPRDRTFAEPPAGHPAEPR